MQSAEQWKVIAGSIYCFLAGLHRRWRGRNPAKSLPILVIGSLRAGGGGKTPVTAWFAERLPEAAILVHPTPDEQALLEVRFPGRVFAAHSFPQAWKRAQAAGFSCAVADGGYQDPRLGGGVRLLLWDEIPASRVEQLHPYGPWRELGTAAERADLLLVRSGLACVVPQTRSWSYRWMGSAPRGLGSEPVLLACGVGNPERVRFDLEGLGVKIQAEHVISDHGAFDPKEIARMELCFPDSPWVGTEKDQPRWPSSAKALHVLVRDWLPEEPTEMLRVVQEQLGLRCGAR